MTNINTYELCDKCVNRNDCDTYSKIFNNGITSLDGKYTKFEIILPQNVHDVCDISVRQDLSSKLIGTRKMYYIS